MKKNIIKIALYVIGFALICYPFITRFIEFSNQTKSVYDYKKEIVKMEEAELKNKLEKANEANKEKSTDIFIVKENEVNQNTISQYDFLKEGEILGYIKIPKINIELPIYEGTTIENLEKGVTHMENTSLPNGQNGTHCVLAGHTGILNAEIFDNIDKLDVGDEFYVDFLGVNNRYTVIKTSIILPDDTSELKIEKDKCLITLVTCTPRSINTHRLLVTAQIDNIEKNDYEQINEQINNNNSEIVEKGKIEIFKEYINNNLYRIIIIVLFLILIITLEIITSKKRRKANERQNS